MGYKEPGMNSSEEHPNTKRTIYKSPVQLLLTIAVSIFAAEAMVMGILHFLPPFSPFVEGLLDSTLLVVLLSPVLYFVLFRPLVLHITERKRAEEEVRKIRRALKTLSHSNQTVVRATEESELLQEMCQVIVEVGGYRLAWVGFAEQDEAKSVRPVAQAGYEGGYLEKLNIMWDESDGGLGPAGQAIRTGTTSVAQSILTHPKFEPWRAEAIERGYASSIAMPLLDGEGAFGVLSVYAAEPDAFDVEELKLLEELVEDLAYGIMALRTRAEHKQAEEALERAHDELKEAYDTLEQAQATAITSEKLAALGRLTAGVSHEILNPLNFITLCVQMLLDDPDINPERAEHLRDIEENANRIVKITQGLLSFSRQYPPERRPIELNDIVTKTLGLLEYDLKLQNIAVELKLAEGLPSIMADEDQLQQVILNLLTNARDVMPKGGRLILTAAGRVEPLFEDEERAVELKVEDTGPGIPPEHMDKLFEPFFTTKPVGEGTGLGLSVCQGIVEAHGGVIWAENVPGGGAVFIIHLNEGREDAKQGISS